MSRLLHAAARGARIQSQWRDAHTPTYQKWQTNNQFVFIDSMRHYRIHPDDEHLQYGPISTALREIAKQPKTIHHKGVNLPHFGFTIFASSESELLEVLRCDWLTHSLFYLFLAEFLADSGL
jgi:hypothetical protein